MNILDHVECNQVFFQVWLFNIAQCHRQLGRNEEAVRFYRTFLSKVPNAPNQKEVRAMIVKLEKMRTAVLVAPNLTSKRRLPRMKPGRCSER